MPFYLVTPPDVTPACAGDAVPGLPWQAGMVAVRVADLAWPAGPGLAGDGRTALVAAGAGEIRTGDVVMFLKPVAIAPAVVRRDGRVQAGGHAADHARLGLAGDRLDELCGTPGVIGEIAAAVTLEGKVKGAARRAMTPALAVRFTLLMTLIPDADSSCGCSSDYERSGQSNRAQMVRVACPPSMPQSAARARTMSSPWCRVGSLVAGVQRPPLSSISIQALWPGSILVRTVKLRPGRRELL